MQALDIIVEDHRWNDADLPQVALVATAGCLDHLGVPKDLCELSILACDDVQIAQLNIDFRGKPTATNVLSWPAEERASAQRGGTPDAPMPGPDGVIALGDIAISHDTCAAEAAAADKPFNAHVTHLIVHGVLHLLGYDHVDDADAALMEGLEVEILGKMGLDDPY